MVCKFAKEGKDSKCMLKNIVYESQCRSCKEEAEKIGVSDDAQQRKDTETLNSNESVVYRYVGESSRTLSERAAEHGERH